MGVENGWEEWVQRNFVRMKLAKHKYCNKKNLDRGGFVMENFYDYVNRFGLFLSHWDFM